MVIAVLASIAVGALADPAFGQSAPEADEEVVVEASKSPFSIDAKALRRAAASFDKHRSLAPEAPLRFRAIDRAPQAESLRVWIERGDAVEAVTPGDDGLLTLPPAAFAEGARLRANRSDKALGLEPEILSPGTALGTRRFGDLRLQCRVALSLHLDELPLYLRAVAPPVGVICSSKHFGYYAYTDFRAGSVEIRGTAASGRASVTERKRFYGGGYAAPLGDRSIGDDAVIELK
jgi:hypothetical protein